MDAYAAVTSLMGSIHLISQSSLDLQEGNKEHLESLYVKIGSLLEFLDNSDNDLQKNVKDLAHEAEDEVESQRFQKGKMTKRSENWTEKVLPRKKGQKLVHQDEGFSASRCHIYWKPQDFQHRGATMQNRGAIFAEKVQEFRHRGAVMQNRGAGAENLSSEEELAKRRLVHRARNLEHI